jgi:hypothetical protein
MTNPDAIAATRRFLKTGALRESEEREPIPLLEDAEVGDQDIEVGGSRSNSGR